MSDKIRENIKIPGYVDNMEPDFTTSTGINRIVSQIMLMNSVQEYFAYRQDRQWRGFSTHDTAAACVHHLADSSMSNEVSTHHDMNYGQVWYPTLVDKLIDFTKAEPLFATWSKNG